jgi:hypothetical protein
MKLFLILLATLPLPLWAKLEIKAPPVRSADAPLLVWDLSPELLPAGFRNFRTTGDPVKARMPGDLPDLTGLGSLHASGSSEFSTAGLRIMLGKFQGPVTVFDLRQEDHGFVNGEPVSWYASNNWANVGRSQPDILAEENALLAALKPGGSVTLSDDSAKKSANRAAPKKTEGVVSAATEAEMVRAAGACYVRIAVSDHARPTDEAVDRFILAVRALPADGWVHFHCRAGRGRTTTFMALYDMLRNARNASLQAIVDRQSLLAGDYDLLGREKEPGANGGAAADRASFVRTFYDYARQNPGGRPQTWTQWLAVQP